MPPDHELRRHSSMSALPQPVTPGGGGGAVDEGIGSNSLHAGGGPPVTPPSNFCGLSPPTSCASASANVSLGHYGAINDNGMFEGLGVSGGGGGGGGYDSRRGSGGGQPFRQSPLPGGAGGGRAGSLCSLGNANGGSFVGGLVAGGGIYEEVERMHLEKLFGQVRTTVRIAVV